jgi:hypothetical protein
MANKYAKLQNQVQSLLQMSDRRSQIPPWERNARILGALILVAWGTFGVAHNDLLWLGTFESQIHLRGASAWLMFGAMNCAAANLLVVVIQRYVRRNSEQAFRTFKQRVTVVGWSLFWSALVAIIFFP